MQKWGNHAPLSKSEGARALPHLPFSFATPMLAYANLVYQIIWFWSWTSCRCSVTMRSTAVLVMSKFIYLCITFRFLCYRIYLFWWNEDMETCARYVAGWAVDQAVWLNRRCNRRLRTHRLPRHRRRRHHRRRSSEETSTAAERRRAGRTENRRTVDQARPADTQRNLVVGHVPWTVEGPDVEKRYGGRTAAERPTWRPKVCFTSSLVTWPVDRRRVALATHCDPNGWLRSSASRGVYPPKALEQVPPLQFKMLLFSSLLVPVTPPLTGSEISSVEVFELFLLYISPMPFKWFIERTQ